MEEPMSKKMKLNETSNLQHIDSCIRNINNSMDNLKAVLSDDLTKDIPMTEVYAGRIKSRKDISKSIRVLNEKMPLNVLSHLKRVRNDSIILCQSNELSMSIKEYIDNKVPELSNVFECFTKVPVPMLAPKLKTQHKDVSKVWSCNFHPDTYLEKLVGNNFFSESELEIHRSYMALTFVIAKWYLKYKQKEITIENIFKDINVCLIVDPNINSVVSIGIDNHLQHPVQHSAMVAIDNVAKTQLGGAWNCQVKICDTNCSSSGIDEQLLTYLKTDFDKINFGAKDFKSKTDLKEQEKTNSEGPYLCTNYYAYMLREPCLMCAMALVHSRAKRLFFCLDNPENGAVKSKVKLHTVSSLNHHYEVFTGFL